METKKCGMISFKVKKKKKNQPRILHPVKISFRNEGEINTVSNDLKLMSTCHQQTYPKRMAKQNSLNREEII